MGTIANAKVTHYYNCYNGDFIGCLPLTPKQINFLLAVANKESNFSSKEVLQKYKLGTSANIKNLKKATLEKDLIDIMPGEKIEIQDPLFEYWLKSLYH